MPRSPNETVPSQFRLGEEAVEQLKALAALDARAGGPGTRAGVLRRLIREAWEPAGRPGRACRRAGAGGKSPKRA